MENSQLGNAYWSSRYEQQQTGWDIGYVSTPIKTYIDQLTDTSINILIPGCGHAHEAVYLLEKGFNNITLADIAEVQIHQLRKQFANANIEILHTDFFHLEGKFDLIIEQTFFSAIHPSQREAYVHKMWQLLNPGGKLVGLLFDVLFESGPPFGGTKMEYEQLISNSFHIRVMDSCFNSIEPRFGRELFIILEYKLPETL
jgi:methyl halide transferase